MLGRYEGACQRLAVLIFGWLYGPWKQSLCAVTALCWNQCSDASVKYQVHLRKNFSRSSQTVTETFTRAAQKKYQVLSCAESGRLLKRCTRGERIIEYSA